MSKNLPTDVIPYGLYCYTPLGVTSSKGKISYHVKTCPYWSMRKDKPPQMNGYCAYLQVGDWENSSTGLLWDACKECNINIG